MDSQITTKRTGALLKENEELKAELERSKAKVLTLKIQKNILMRALMRFEAEAAPSHAALDFIDDGVPLDAHALYNFYVRTTKQLLTRRNAPFGSTNFNASSAASKASVSTAATAAAASSKGNAAASAKKRRRKQLSAAELQLRKNNKVAYGDDGNPILPLTLGILTVHRLGRIVHDRASFHSKRYIWPVGFESSRPYASTVHADRQTLYHSRIVDGGDAPRFEIVPNDAPDRVFAAATATGAWSAVLRQANELRHKESFNSASGPDYFGFANPIIAKLIEDLPHAALCTSYYKFSDEGAVASGVIAAGLTSDVDAASQPLLGDAAVARSVSTRTATPPFEDEEGLLSSSPQPPSSALY